MAEYKREISIAVTIAVVAALAVGLVATTAIPNGPSTVTVTHTEFATGPPFNSTSTTSTTTSSSPTTMGVSGKPSAQVVSCTVTTGTCALTILNNSTSTLELESCQMWLIVNTTVSSGATTSQYGNVNGTISGPASEGMSANSESAASCSVPIGQFAAIRGSVISGTIAARLLANPASPTTTGTNTTISFEGAWS